MKEKIQKYYAKSPFTVFQYIFKLAMQTVHSLSLIETGMSISIYLGSAWLLVLHFFY